jgi:hypothetical protein
VTAPVKLAKAELHELDADMKETRDKQNWTTLQFNPESLKVSFANQIQTPAGPGATGGGGGAADKSGTPARQFVGAGTTKLSLSVYFDVNAPNEGEKVDDVRRLTQKVAYFITPKAEGKTFIPPAVRFLWGSFQFDGLMDSVEETLEFFSPEGKPLRASMALSMSQQRITKFDFANTAAGPGAARAAAAPGTRPLAEAPAGATVQGLAAQAGVGDNWQAIASANGIENPLRLTPGQLLNLDVTAPGRR